MEDVGRGGARSGVALVLCSAAPQGLDGLSILAAALLLRSPGRRDEGRG